MIWTCLRSFNLSNKPKFSIVFLVLGWIGKMMFMSSSSSKASMILVNLSLSSTVSALCIVKVRMFSILSISSSARPSSYSSFSLFFDISRFLKHASTTVFPVMNILFLEIPSIARLIADSSVGTKYSLEHMSAASLLISSGIVSSKERSPASTWPTGMCNLLATSAPASTAFVSPCTSRISGFSSKRTSSIPSIILPVCFPCEPDPTWML